MHEFFKTPKSLTEIHSRASLLKVNTLRTLGGEVKADSSPCIGTALGRSACSPAGWPSKARAKACSSTAASTQPACAAKGGEPNSCFGHVASFSTCNTFAGKKEQIPYFCIKCKALFLLCLCTRRGTPGWQADLG